ncbi:MarR family winged helix-turn-helix transcriptional regulator [Amycolatopsis pithecellobii]|uniref:MarR family transcriptional regulator n=1 Tax=Amycolatopsis pithecellobii TaxID=664692 RepID=A0A6N7Z574_9PSEU|nr:MarR family winged helix-turn-helix transcriptional regulator [Amycolatopsis pithecellobii]MTD54546.1 hypothetical protein [Amycolatopsis pithecellobii]
MTGADEGPFNRLTPIGLLLNGLSAALTDYVDRTLRLRNGIGRLHWQILSTVHDTPGIEARSISERGRAMFDEETFDAIVADLTSAGWVHADDSAGRVRLTLTGDGLETYRKARRTQAETRELVTEGLSEEDYEFIIHGLETMLANTERAIAGLEPPTPSPEDNR